MTKSSARPTPAVADHINRLEGGPTDRNRYFRKP
jgi:hypothetical protein